MKITCGWPTRSEWKGIGLFVAGQAAGAAAALGGLWFAAQRAGQEPPATRAGGA